MKRYICTKTFETFTENKSHLFNVPERSIWTEIDTNGHFCTIGNGDGMCMTVDWLTMNRHFVEESECRPKDLEKVCEEEDNAEDEDDSMVNDFISATQPAVDWMNEYGDPHGKIIVTDEGAEYLVGGIGTGRHEEE